MLARITQDNALAVACPGISGDEGCGGNEGGMEGGIEGGTAGGNMGGNSGGGCGGDAGVGGGVAGGGRGGKMTTASATLRLLALTPRGDARAEVIESTSRLVEVADSASA